MAQNTVMDGVDYGPLASLVGNWKGDKGMDVAPDVDGKEENPYYETILFEAIGSVKNAGTQVLAVLRYHQVVSRKSDRQVFHNETGYWMWDASTGTIMQSLTIPRGVCLLAGGKAAVNQPNGMITFDVRAALEDKDWGILQAPFMKEKAKTREFTHTISVSGKTLTYSETVKLEIYGKSFDHTDQNVLTKG